MANSRQSLTQWKNNVKQMDGEKISQAFGFIDNAILVQGECLEKNAQQQTVQKLKV